MDDKVYEKEVDYWYVFEVGEKSQWLISKSVNNYCK